jgi:hypothetical protein
VLGGRERKGEEGEEGRQRETKGGRDVGMENKEESRRSHSTWLWMVRILSRLKCVPVIIH